MWTSSRIGLKFAELPLHPHAIHLELALTVDKHTAVDAELLYREERMWEFGRGSRGECRYRVDG